MGLLSLDTLTLFLASGCNVESGFIHPLHVLVETEILALALGRPPPPPTSLAAYGGTVPPGRVLCALAL